MQKISDFLRKYYNKKYNKSENKVLLYLNRSTRVIGDCKILLDKLEENFKIDNLDYNVFEKVNNPISGKKTGNFITTYSTHLLFWIPSDKEKEKYEQI